MCACVTSAEPLFAPEALEAFDPHMRVIKLLLYTGILGMSAALPLLRFLEAEAAWNSPTRVTDWLPSPAVAWWIVPATLWLMMVHATLQRRVLTQRFYGAILGLSIFGGGAAGGALGPPKAMANHPDLLLIDQARGLQLELENRFVIDGVYPRIPAFESRTFHEFTPAASTRLVMNSGICERVGDLLLNSDPKRYQLRICGLAGEPGGMPKHLRQHDKIMTLGPDTGLQRALFLKMRPEESPGPPVDGPRRRSRR